MIDKEKNTCVYCKFTNEVYVYMTKYSRAIGSSVADFVRQAVMERIIRLGQLNDLPFEELKK